MNYTYNITHKKHINMKTQTGGKSKHPIILWNYGKVLTMSFFIFYS